MYRKSLDKIFSFPNSFFNKMVRPKIVCICGSGRFLKQMRIAEFNETLLNKIVLMIGCNTKDIARTYELKHHKPMLDKLHIYKIELSDEILVIDVNEYIGESTRKEIDYAKLRGIKIRYWSKEAKV